MNFWKIFWDWEAQICNSSDRPLEYPRGVATNFSQHPLEKKTFYSNLRIIWRYILIFSRYFCLYLLSFKMLYNWKFWNHAFQSSETFTYVTLVIIQGRVKHQQAAAGEEDSFLRVGDKVVLMTWKWPGAPTLWAAPGWSTGLSGLRLGVSLLLIIAHRGGLIFNASLAFSQPSLVLPWGETQQGCDLGDGSGSEPALMFSKVENPQRTHGLLSSSRDKFSLHRGFMRLEA